MSLIYAGRGIALRRLLAVVLASLMWWALVPGIALADDDDDDRQSVTASVPEHEEDDDNEEGRSQSNDEDDDGDGDDDDDENGNGGSGDGSALSFGAKLRPGQEVPPVVSDGRGRVSFDVDGTTVTFRLHWEDLTTAAVAAHIHCGAVGVSGPVGVNLFTTTMGTSGTVNGSFTAPNAGNACGWLTVSDVLGAVMSGNTYVNVHSTTFPAGEIRGQLAAGNVSFDARLRPGQEVPPVVSDGQGRVSFDVEGTTVSFKLRWEDLTTTAVAAHIHCGAVGASGPVGVTLFMGTMGTDGNLQGTFNAPDPVNACGWITLAHALTAMLSGNTYVNVHSTTFPGGEIRGQLSQN
jgi:hypothetical protein